MALQLFRRCLPVLSPLQKLQGRLTQSRDRRKVSPLWYCWNVVEHQPGGCSPATGPVVFSICYLPNLLGMTKNAF